MTIATGAPEKADHTPGQDDGRSTPVAFLQRYGRAIGLPIIVIVMAVFFSIESNVFLSLSNFRNIGVSAAALAAVSFGQTFAILTAGLDLSVGATVAFVSIVGALVMRDHGVLAGLVASLAAGAGVGLFNGIVITRFKVFPFIATLAMMSVVSGLALSLSGGVAVTGVPEAFSSLAYTRIAGVPIPTVIALSVLVICIVTLRYTKLGRRIYAIGGNEEAARLSGIAIGAVKIAAYVLSGLCAAVGSLILTARVASGQPSLGATLPLESVAAVVLGGVSLFGGRGSVVGVAFGVLFISILSNGLNLLNVPSYTQMMVIGGALILAVSLDQTFIGSRVGKRS
jgi:ribose transport system permease protein